MSRSSERIHLAFQRLLMRLFPQELFYIGGPDPLPPPLTPEEPDTEHDICVEISDGEYYVTVKHPMEKAHSITWLAAVSDSGCQFAKLYPESLAEARFRMQRVRWIYAYCNRHGLFRVGLRNGRIVKERRN